MIKNILLKMFDLKGTLKDTYNFGCPITKQDELSIKISNFTCNR